MVSDPVTVAMLGVGYWGPNVLRNLLRITRCSLRCVCDIRQEALSKAAETFSIPCRLTVDPQSAFDDTEIQAVVIATPAATHYELARAALESGKHVLVEKPLALRTEEAETLCKLADASNLKLMVGHTFLFNNAVRKLKEYIDTGRCGEIHYITSTRTHLGLVRKDVDVVWDLASHDVSIMNYLLGTMPKTVSAVAGYPLGSERADVAFIHLFYPGNIICQLHASWVDSNKVRQVCVIGSDARILFNDLDDLEPVRIFEKGIGQHQKIAPEFGDFRLILRDGDIISPKIELREPLNQMLEAFFSLVQNGEATPSSGRSGLAVTRILAQAERSIAAQGCPQPVIEDES